MFRRLTWAVCLAGALLFSGATIQSASACPSCREANQTNSALPAAYQFSILFMLTIPALILTGFSVGLYRLNKAQEQALNDFESGDVWNAPPPAEDE